jgi:methyltransferase family protein
MKQTPNFNLLARPYRWLEWITFGPFLSRCRCAFLPELGTCRNALVIGDGDGRFTKRLLEENGDVLVDAVDLSRDMLLALARNAGVHAGRVRIHLADARQWNPHKPPYDLIVTHFFLDCLTTDEVTTLARRLQASVTPGARWVVSDFAIPEGWFGRLVAQPLVTTLYGAFRLLTGLRINHLPNQSEALAAAGFTLTERQRWLGGLLVGQIWVATL